jgi:hypothetical protein
VPNDLNTRATERASVALVGLGVLGLAAAPLDRRAAAAALTAIGGAALLNLPFYRFLGRARSPLFAVQSVPLHLLYFACAGSGLLLAAADLATTPNDSSRPRA